MQDKGCGNCTKCGSTKRQLVEENGRLLHEKNNLLDQITKKDERIAELNAKLEEVSGRCVDLELKLKIAKPVEKPQEHKEKPKKEQRAPRRVEKERGNNLGLQAQQAVAELVRTFGPMTQEPRDVTWDRAFHIVGELLQKYGHDLDIIIGAAEWLADSLDRYSPEETGSFLNNKAVRGGDFAEISQCELDLLHKVFNQKSVGGVKAEAKVTA